MNTVGCHRSAGAINTKEVSAPAIAGRRIHLLRQYVAKRRAEDRDIRHLRPFCVFRQPLAALIGDSAALRGLRLSHTRPRELATAHRQRGLAVSPRWEKVVAACPTVRYTTAAIERTQSDDSRPVTTARPMTRSCHLDLKITGIGKTTHRILLDQKQRLVIRIAFAPPVPACDSSASLIWRHGSWYLDSRIAA